MTVIIKKSEEFNKFLKYNLSKRFKNKDRGSNAHVSDIIPTACLRKQYYYRKYPELAPTTDESVLHFVRGLASEYAITNLADMGVAQSDEQFEGITAHPDILASEPNLFEGQKMVVELKDTSRGDRIDFSDDTFKSYTYQLIYYMIMTGAEIGVISIKYNIKEMQWRYRDREGSDWFCRRKDAKDVEVQSWEVRMGKDDPVRELFKQQMRDRRDLFLSALNTDEVSILSRVKDKDVKFKCGYCPYRNRCYEEDDQNDTAASRVEELTLLEEEGIVQILRE